MSSFRTRDHSRDAYHSSAYPGSSPSRHGRSSSANNVTQSSHRKYPR
jgi:hypothetical protein